MSETPLDSQISTASVREMTKNAPGYLLPVALATTAVLIGGTGLLAYQRLQSYRSNVPPGAIARGVTVAGIDLGGLTLADATARVRQWAQSQVSRPITFTAPQSGRTWNIPLADVGGQFDLEPALNKAAAVGKDLTLWDQIRQGEKPFAVAIAPAFRFDENALDKRLRRIAATVDRAPANARARITDSGQITVGAPEQKGVSLDVAATHHALLKNGPDGLRNGATVALVIREEKPRITAADLGKMGNVLSSFTTEYSSSTSDRSHNVELAAAKINGTLLAPGEEFSYNKIVGPREERYGWKNALMFQDGEVVPGMGGGVCQVASTLYNAVLRTDLKVTERQNHSIKVHYVDPGRDATVAYGSLDFRFTNTTTGPVLILARTRNRRLTFNIYGATPPAPNRIEIVSGPYRSNSLGGITVATYRVVHQSDGKVLRQYLHTDSYRAPQPKSGPTPRRTRRSRPTPAATPAPTIANRSA